MGFECVFHDFGEIRFLPRLRDARVGQPNTKQKRLAIFAPVLRKSERSTRSDYALRSLAPSVTRLGRRRRSADAELSCHCWRDKGGIRAESGTSPTITSRYLP